MTTRTGCEAIQYSDQMQCGRCGLAWDTNDPDPPACAATPPKYFNVDNRLCWHHDSGQYLNDCLSCGGRFLGGKHRRQCRQCEHTTRQTEADREYGRKVIADLLEKIR